MRLLSDTTVKAAAAAIANARGNRRGMPSISNVLDILPEKLRVEVLEDAMAALKAAWEVEVRKTEGD